jgi:hypothetical protein
MGVMRDGADSGLYWHGEFLVSIYKKHFCPQITQIKQIKTSKLNLRESA